MRRRLLLLFFHSRAHYHTPKSCNTALSIARHLLLLKVRAHLAALRRRRGEARRRRTMRTAEHALLPIYPQLNTPVSCIHLSTVHQAYCINMPIQCISSTLDSTRLLPTPRAQRAYSVLSQLNTHATAYPRAPSAYCLDTGQRAYWPATAQDVYCNRANIFRAPTAHPQLNTSTPIEPTSSGVPTSHPQLNTPTSTAIEPTYSWRGVFPHTASCLAN